MLDAFDGVSFFVSSAVLFVLVALLRGVWRVSITSCFSLSVCKNFLQGHHEWAVQDTRRWRREERSGIEREHCLWATTAKSEYNSGPTQHLTNLISWPKRHASQPLRKKSLLTFSCRPPEWIKIERISETHKPCPVRVKFTSRF